MIKGINTRLQAHLQKLAALWNPDRSEAAKQRAGGRVTFELNRRARRRRGGYGGRHRGPILAGNVTRASLQRGR